MASGIYYMAPSQTLDAAAIDNGRVVEKILITSGALITVFGPSVRAWVTDAWVNQPSGTSLTVAAGQIIEGPFTKVSTPASVTAVAYLK